MSAEFVDLYKAIRDDTQMAYSELRNRDALAHLNETVQHSGDTLLHVAAKWKRRNIAETIINLQPSLLSATNIKGETPLHVAASVGSQEVTQLIIDWCDQNESVENGERLLRMVSEKEEETVLHRATRNGHLEVVKLLINKDPDLTKMLNKDGDSPLFMAVDTKHFEIARIIFTVSDCSLQGRKNMNALHAAIARQLNERALINLNDVVERPTALRAACSLIYLYLMIKRGRFTWKSTDSTATRIARDLIEKREPELLEQQDDEFGWTPLHYAAHMNATQIIELLLSAKHSVAYIIDHDGMTALHVAAKQGHVSAMKSLVKICPEICDAVDNKGQSALHVAVKSGKRKVVLFILGFFDDDIINMQDYQGNTALHLAASHNIRIFYLLVRDGRSSKVAINSDRVTVMDIIQSSVDASFVKGRMKYRLINGGGTVGLEQCLGRKKNEIPQDQQLEWTQKRVLDKADDRISSQIDLIAATLIATVSFAAGLAVPGGFKDDGPDEGTAILAKKTDFHKFVIFNAIAFCCSVSSIITGWFRLRTKKSFLYSAPRPLILLSMVAMVVAFIYGTSAFLGDSEAELATGVKHIGWVCFSFVYLFRVFGIV